MSCAFIYFFYGQQPKSLQEIWHSVRQRQQEEERENGINGSIYYDLGVCDFGADCEMPWLHPIVDANLFTSHAQDEVC